ncbi:transmembrane protein, putative (macronuclear) [Tetrahymena thermophila SB210]|uniref:Transmembrane protein, putative n=1 Tax=Tetrahymena thermophila (strain SB210) TaxID=312017 RepID=Q23F25_TETTS|nr:transmembrane protein, putative [Tetrahymena thermophila SB210]EAR95080.2 transmembrane protein, putative [Tetrahymena thermophila SB210]|eukprot:XP_001015325.2 transmembrane protein, putative [Tetrahymena thermophila SB210]
MNLLKFDLFSSEFQFNAGYNMSRKGSYQGLVLTFISLLIIFSYFVYLLYLYFNNLIDTKYRSQNFITQDRLDVPLQQNLISFSFQYTQDLTVDQYSAVMNKTYLVYVAHFYYQKNNITTIIDLDIVKCKDPELQGFNCIDFSKISNNYTLYFDPKSTQTSMIILFFYGCLDVDRIKKIVPENCATQEEIDNLVDNNLTTLNIKLQTQQFNTTSKQIQTNYRNLQNYIQSDSSQQVLLKMQTQKTKVNQGFLYQSQQTFSSPISFMQNTQNFDKQKSLKAGVGPYDNILLQIDEIILDVEITYPTITEILALVNSFATIFLLLKVLGRFFSQKLIKQDIFLLLLQNLFQDKYEEVIIKNKLIDKTDVDQLFKDRQINSLQKQSQNTVTVLKQDNIQDQIKNQDHIELNQNNQDFLDIFASGKCRRNSRDQLSYNKNKQGLICQQIDLQADKQTDIQDKKDILDQRNQNYTEEDYVDNFIPKFSTKSIDYVKKSQKMSLKSPILNLQQQQNNFKDQIINQSLLSKSSEISYNFATNKRILNKHYSNNCETFSILDQMIFSPKLTSETNKFLLSPKKNACKIESLYEQSHQKKQSIQKNPNYSQNHSIQNMIALNQIEEQPIQKSNLDLLVKLSSFKQKITESKIIQRVLAKLLFKTKFCGKKVYYEKLGFDINSMDKVRDQVNKNLNIYQLYKDIIFLKKAIMIILTNEQLAVLNQVGCSTEFLSMNDTFKDKNFTEMIQKSKLSHFEQQFAISENRDLQQEFIQKFYQKCKKDKHISEMDKRILSSIIIKERSI